METTLILGIMKNALLTALVVQGPILVAVLAVGLGISLLQAVTQVHEMTLVFVPKILAVVGMLFFLGHWMLGALVSLGHYVFTSFPGALR